MIVGPRNPPRLPVALINAMPAAAPSPRRNDVGSDQNGGVKLYSPIAAIDNATNDTIGEMLSDAVKSPSAATAAQLAVCHRRSPVRSECAATVTMPIAATRNGTAVA